MTISIQQSLDRPATLAHRSPVRLKGASFEGRELAQQGRDYIILMSSRAPLPFPLPPDWSTEDEGLEATPQTLELSSSLEAKRLGGRGFTRVLSSRRHCRVGLQDKADD
ncbi:hypothetical protein C0Q70_12410 [Pomacea canaliculata]|uniref:Uncharacterized protein n=1 Tax=Pomacea canaliculata TaxID=400727 RepID=A0A2T7P1G2_POMCA|nr:hypothetical protein C0Q70_12410 [Pomacea canaliculata]